MGRFFSWIGGTLGTTGAIALYVGLFAGWAYWMWMAIQFGSFIMFIFGLLGPLGFFASLLGLWSLLLGVPFWLLHLVG
jgi:hypothetical protein